MEDVVRDGLGVGNPVELGVQMAEITETIKPGSTGDQRGLLELQDRQECQKTRAGFLTFFYFFLDRDDTQRAPRSRADRTQSRGFQCAQQGGLDLLGTNVAPLLHTQIAQLFPVEFNFIAPLPLGLVADGIVGEEGVERPREGAWNRGRRSRSRRRRSG